MRVQKRKSVLFLLIFFLMTGFCNSPSHGSGPIPGPAILGFTASEAGMRFGKPSTAHFLVTFHDLEGAPAAYLFLVTKDQESIPEDIGECIEEARRTLEEGEHWIEKGQTQEGLDLISRSRALLFQEDRFATLLVSTENAQPSLLAFHHGLPTYVIAKTEAQERAEALSHGKQVIPVGVLYLSPLEYYFEFETEGQNVLVSPFHSKIAFRDNLEEDLEPRRLPVSKGPGECPADLIQRNLYEAPETDQAEADLPVQASDPRIIHGVPDYNQRTSLPNSCGPTAGACLLGHWDTLGYDDFLQGAETYDDVTRLIEELCEAMDWNPSSGVNYSRIPAGLRLVIDDRSYEFDISNLYGIDSLNIVRQEINAAHPFIYGSQENPWETAHYVVVAGYQESFIIVHDNWWSTPTDYFVHWDALGHTDDMMTTLTLQGQEEPPSEPLPSDVGGSGGGCFISAAAER